VTEESTEGGTRQRILTEAVGLFNERGYTASTFRELAERLQITGAAINYHFRHKDDILAAVVASYLSDLDDLLQRSPVANSPTRRRQLLAEFVDLVIAHRDVVRFLARDVGAANRQNLAERLEDQHRALRSRLVGPSAGDRAHVRAAAAIGAVLRPVTHLDDVDPETTRRELSEVAYRALAG
jgi:AcrR family transcriptional regulator